MGAKLTPTKVKFLRIVADAGRPLSIAEIAAIMDRPISVASMVRNILWAAHMVETWRNYSDPVYLTPAGRTALNSAERGET